MAIELREEVGVSFKIVEDVKESLNASQQLSYNNISEKSVMVDIEGIHSIITKNLNYYEPNCLKESIPKWTYPYEKPLIMHHNDKNGVIIGRIKNAKFIESNTRSNTPGIIFTCNVGASEGVEGVKNGTLATVSIGATVYDLRCSICGQNLAKDGACEHDKGRRYDDKLCFWIVKEMEPKELSYVIVPSDKYAHNIKIYEPTGKKNDTVSESQEDNEVKKLSIKDLYYDELSAEIAKKEAQKLEESEDKDIKDPEVKVEDKKVDEKPEEGETDDSKDKDEKVDEVSSDKKDEEQKSEEEDEKDAKKESEEKPEEKAEDKSLEELKSLKAKVEELEAAMASLKAKLKKEEGLRESAETKLLQLKKEKRVALAEQINSLRQGLDLEAEEIDSLIESSEETLIGKLDVLKDFTGNIPKIAKKLPKLKSDSLVEEAEDNTVVYEKKANDDIDIEKIMIEKYKKLINRD